jgi:hypothetical protein
MTRVIVPLLIAFRGWSTSTGSFLQLRAIPQQHYSRREGHRFAEWPQPSLGSVREQAPTAALDDGVDEHPILVDDACADQRVRQRDAAGYHNVFAVAGLKQPTVKIRTFVVGAIATLSTAAVTLISAPLASAWPTVDGFGAPLSLYDGAGTLVQTWTVKDLKKSSDTIFYPQMVGDLWEANVTVNADQGNILPIIPFFNARAASGMNYREIWWVPTAQGVDPSVIPSSNQTTGKLYFDVYGEAPNSVVYNDAVQDLLIWVK